MLKKLIAKLTDVRKTLVEKLGLENEAETDFTNMLENELIEVYNSFTNEDDDYKMIDEVLKKDKLDKESKAKILAFMDKKLKTANELEGKMSRNECKDTNAASFRGSHQPNWFNG